MMLTEVRQDRRPGSPTFGHTATRQPTGSRIGEWGVMTPDEHGGYYASSEQIAGWSEMVPVVDAAT